MGKEYRHLRVLREQLEKNTNKEIQTKILNGMDYIKNSSTPEIKVKWAAEIIERLDKYIEKDICIKIRENCACLKSNERSIYAQMFKRLRRQHDDSNEYLNAVVDYLNSTRPLRRCGEVSLHDGKIITVIARNHCDCQVISKGLKNPLSVTWCHCCKGSILSVIKYIFPDKKCDLSIKETVASGGKTCTFITTFV